MQEIYLSKYVFDCRLQTTLQTSVTEYRKPLRELGGRNRGRGGGAHCTEIDFALSFGAVIVKMIDLSKTESRDFFGIILGQENSQKLHLLPKSC